MLRHLFLQVSGCELRLDAGKSGSSVRAALVAVSEAGLGTPLFLFRRRVFSALSSKTWSDTP